MKKSRFFIVFLTFSLILLFFTFYFFPKKVNGQDIAYDDIFYILPIFDGVAVNPGAYKENMTAEELINDLKGRLGEGGRYARIGFSEVYRYMSETYGEDQDYRINPDHLDKIFQLAVNTNTPFLIHLNGFQWGGCGPLMKKLANDRNSVMWDQNDNPWLGCQDGDINISLNKYNESFRYYKKRNLQDAVRKIVEFQNGPHGYLFLGVSTDSEIAMNSYRAAQQGKRFDYNPNMLRQYREETGKTERPEPTNKDWINFKISIIDRTVEEIVSWIQEMGIPKEKIYTHQIGFTDGDVIGEQVYNAPLITAKVENGSLGVTTYGRACFNEELFQKARELSSNWGIFEYNPLKSKGQENYKALQIAYNYGAHIIAPYHWMRPKYITGDYPYTVRDSSFQGAIKKFIEDHKDQPRPRLTPTPTVPWPTPTFTPTLTLTPTPKILLGDLNNDGRVDGADVKVLLLKHGIEADLNFDNIVNGIDFGKMYDILKPE